MKQRFLKVLSLATFVLNFLKDYRNPNLQNDVFMNVLVYFNNVFGMFSNIPNVFEGIVSTLVNFSRLEHSRL